MSEQLTQYFDRYAENAIHQMKASVLAIKFYERIKLRLAQKEDLSSELPIIASVGEEGTMEVVREAISEYKQKLNSAWELHPRLKDLGKLKISLVVNEREHLPRAHVDYQFKSDAGTVKIKIASAAETYKLEINAGRNPMTAKVACTELEKQLTFIALLS
jgi:hypothetical protein